MRAGLVSKVVPAGKVVDEAIQLAERIAQFSQPVVGLCKEAVNACTCEGCRRPPRLKIARTAPLPARGGQAGQFQLLTPTSQGRAATRGLQRTR